MADPKSLHLDVLNFRLQIGFRFVGCWTLASHQPAKPAQLQPVRAQIRHRNGQTYLLHEFPIHVTRILRRFRAIVPGSRPDAKTRQFPGLVVAPGS